VRTLLALALAIALSLGASAQGAQDIDALWAATLHGLDGRPVAMQQFRGRPLVVNFWARWCGPCRDEIPALVRERARFRDRGVEVLGIAIEDKAEAVREFAKAYDMDYPVLLAGDKAGIALMQALGNAGAGIPFTLVIDRRGALMKKKIGPMDQAGIEEAFRQALR